MNLAPSPEQEELKSAARELLAREVTPERLLQWEAEPRGAHAALGKTIAELGWIGLGLPAAAGGSGADLIDVACLLEECARGLLPEGLVAQIRAAVALALVDPENRHLGELARGAKSIAIAFDERRARDAARFETSLAAVAAGHVVSGEKAYVEAAAADLHLVAARSGSEPCLALVERAAGGVSLEPLRGFANDEQAHVRYERAPATLLAPRTGGGTAIAAIRRQQQALALAEMVGGMRAVLDLTVAYVKEREQFGQKIALFQAVRHQIADMGTTCTAARHLAWQAISRVAKRSEQGTELASAVAFVGQAFKRICWAGHHLHGGAGFVVEHRMRFHSERAQSLCVRQASEAPALDTVASALLD